MREARATTKEEKLDAAASVLELQSSKTAKFKKGTEVGQKRTVIGTRSVTLSAGSRKWVQTGATAKDCGGEGDGDLQDHPRQIAILASYKNESLLRQRGTGTGGCANSRRLAWD